MKIICWDTESVDVDHENLIVANVDNIKTDDAISLCKINLMGEYHAILIKRYEEHFCDAEIYLLTWDGEVSDGGQMDRIDHIALSKILNKTLFV